MMKPDSQPAAFDLDALRQRLAEAEETLRAIRQDEVDAVVVTDPCGEKVYTFKSADRPYRLMIECMWQGAVTLTTEGVVLYCNASFAAMLQEPVESIVGSGIGRFVAPSSRDFFATLLGRNGQGELLLEIAGGAPLPAYVALSRLRLEDPREPVICMVVTDLTEQKRNERLVADERLARVEAEAMNQAKDRFLATLSHELRTPLTPVLALISALEADGRLPDDLHREIAMARRNVELEARLIDDLLDLTRVSSGKLQLDRRSVDLREIVEHAIRISSAGGLASGRIGADFADDDLRLWGDAPRLTQVFWNLLNNAVKFTPEGKAIAVHARRENPDGIVVEVSDAGVGIDPEEMPRIFDAFEQGRVNVTRRFGGLGLGLAIAKTIAELHGGSISVFSAGRDRGATFRVHLPVGPQPAEVQASAPAEPEEARSPARLRILLVEDHFDTACALAQLLSLQGHEVRTAESIAQALAAAEESGFDLVISDLGLPDGTGQQLMLELSRRFHLRGIALSGYGMEEDVRQSREAGFERHLTKPVNIQALEAAIQQVAAAASPGDVI